MIKRNLHELNNTVQQQLKSITEANNTSSNQNVITGDVTVFDCDLGELRVVVKDDQPLFCLKDVCDSLGLTTPAKVAEQIKEEFDVSNVVQKEVYSTFPLANAEKDGVSFIHPIQNVDVLHAIPIQDSLGRLQPTTFITEPQLYFVLMRSNKDKAKGFRQWIVNTVLPTIRKTGKYDAREPKAPTTMIEALELALEQAKKIEEQKMKIEQDKPKVEFADAVSKTSDAISVGDYAKLLTNKTRLDIGERKLFTWLRENQYLDHANQPYQKYLNQGLFTVIERYWGTSKQHVSLQTLITGKGQIYLFDKLNNK